jgi:hypothetical protein
MGKNVKLFEAFTNVNSAKSSFASDVEDLWNELNILYALIDEGYIENGRLAQDFKPGSGREDEQDEILPADIEDVNDYLDGQGIKMDVVFKTEADLIKWIEGIAIKCTKFGKNYTQPNALPKQFWAGNGYHKN